ncbi:MAG: fumarate/nitrate reduction transcriptional regulator Fnr [Pseudomonadota bacterium]
MTMQDAHEKSHAPEGVSCASCGLYQFCLPLGLSSNDMELLDRIVASRHECKRGGYLFRAGDPFQSLYAIRSGSFKIFDLGPEGREKITGFYLTGDMLGMDAISANQHFYNATALEDSRVCAIPLERLEELGHHVPALMHHFHKLMSREVVHDQSLALLLNGTKAEQRVAVFLLDLSQRFATRGYSPHHFNLRMTREEIGNYLGLTLETVSRVLSKFQSAGLVKVHHKDIVLRDPDRMREIVDPTLRRH